jgi:uncharacterized protein (DUF2237 family)
MKELSQESLNILGKPLKPCCFEPKTGFYRDGYCKTGKHDVGSHIICAEVTAEFLEFTASKGNDLSISRPEFDFPGLKPGDRWCLCALRWKEALHEGLAPPVILESCHLQALEYVTFEELKQNAL